MGSTAGGAGPASGAQTRLSPQMDEGGAAIVLGALPVAVYTTDAAGKITYYNEAAAGLWGVRPELGISEFTGAWRLFWPDGTPLPHNECPMAVALRERRPVKGIEVIAERPDGTRVLFAPSPVPLFNSEGVLTGAVNTLVDLSDRLQFEQATHRLVAVVESSDDAIIAKDLEGNITAWNAGAGRLFGYTAEEVTGKPITIIIPADRQAEEPAILARIRAGEHIDHYETVRQRKDGSLVDISLTVSPIKDHRGRVIGASKIARDISERKRAQERQLTLLREMSHRVKNLFALSSAVISLSASRARTPAELATSVQDRLRALARAHDLTLADIQQELAATSTTLTDLVTTVLAPYAEPDSRVMLAGPEVTVQGHAVTGLALVLHEFATNAAKYGALTRNRGRIAVTWLVENGSLLFVWAERGGPEILGPSQVKGFGTFMSDSTVKNQLAGNIERDWHRTGLVVTMRIPIDRLA